MPEVSLDDLPEDAATWIAMQRAIDDGMQLCPACEGFGWRQHCGACGERLDGKTWRECPDCKSQSPTPYCEACGTQILTQFVSQMEAGKVDWLAEGRSAWDVMARIAQKRPDVAGDLFDEAATEGEVMAALRKQVEQRDG